jgi:thioesterase domain-containing protein
MVPAHFVELERLPTTPNGKLDRKALPRVSFEARRARLAARDELERKISAIFQDILRISEVGVRDDFFDLGGHSLLGTELVFRLRRELGIDLPVKALFETPTIEGLAAFARAPVTRSGVRLPPNVVLARQGNGVPWFCFPAIAGTAAPYLSSVVASAGPSVYLLEAGGLNGGQAHESVEAMVGEFIQSIRAVVSKGPIRLTGWSFGALTAFVAAQRLTAEGWTIDELLLLDPALPGMAIGGFEPPELALAFIADVAESVGKSGVLSQLQASSSAPSATPTALFRQAQQLGIFPASISTSDFENRLRVYTASVRALRSFAPRSPEDAYQGQAFILAASDGNGPHASAWLRWLPQAKILVEPATHHAILEHLAKYLG